MFPEKLVCPACGNTTHFRETALRYTVQPFTIPAGGKYGDADWNCFETLYRRSHAAFMGEENYPVEILCDAEACRNLPDAILIWRNPNLEAAERLTRDEILRAYARHAAGDWVDLDDEDRAANNRALKTGARLLSIYRSAAGVKFFIITEADRSVTTVLLPQEC